MTYALTSGDDKAKITHTVTKDGQDVSVGSLSGGEERGLILSVDLGLAEVIANRSGVNLPSVLMLDECTDGLDYVGKEKLLDALRQIAQTRCIIVIDHSTEFSALFDRNIKIIKKGGVSSLVIE
jgi:DNA repair exonuclease SbcCD ATPase subunit